MEAALNVVITGASAGLGRAMAREFGKANARVGLISRDLPALEATAAEVESLGGTAATYAADVSDDKAVEAAAASFEDRLGPIDVWVNNAMVSVFSPIKEMEAAEFRRVTEVNLPWLRSWHPCRATANAPAEPRSYYSGRLGSCRAEHTATVGILRDQARHRRIHGLVALRTLSRQERCQSDCDSHAGYEYATVHMGQEQTPAFAAASASHL